LKHDSLRVALALNSPLHIEATAYREARGWRLELRGRAAARYPRRSRTELGRLFGQALVIEEGLFAALQDAGWLHPYEAVWTWSVAEGDPRLEDLRTPERTWFERLLVHSTLLEEAVAPRRMSDCR
jgi:hypothetical protein